MHKYNKIRGILRAKQGSQIPKFQYGGNPYTIGSLQPSTLQDATTNSFNSSILNSNLYNLPENSKLNVPLTDFEQNLWNSRNGELSRVAANNTNFKIPESVKTIPSFTQKLGFVGKGLGKKIGNFANENQDLIIGGIDYLSNRLFGGTKNSSEYDTIIGSAKTLRNNLKGPAKWWATAGIAAVEGLNKIGASTVDNTYINQDFANKAGGSYTGTIALGEKAMANNGVEFGLFNRGGYRSAKRTRNKFLNQQSIATGIVNEASDQRAMINDLNYLNYQMQSNGGYDQMYMGIRAKQGGKLQDKISLIKQKRTVSNFINLDTKEIEWEPETIIFKTGGIITQDWDIVFELPVKQFEEGGKIRTLEELIKYAKEQNPRFIQRLSEEPRGIKFIDDEGNEAEGSHYLESMGEYVVPRIQEINGELKFLSQQEAIDRAIESGNYLKMLPEEAIIFAKRYKQGWPEFFEKFKEGGKTKEELETPEIEETSQKNLIPEGALHKNKHHMEHTEGLTQKGIPVIDNDGEQQAEIELDEIIFTLEVTKKLEELYKEGTDEAAIEAGKLLVKEILFNTDDRTGLIAKCQEGGKL